MHVFDMSLDLASFVCDDRKRPIGAGTVRQATQKLNQNRALIAAQLRSIFASISGSKIYPKSMKHRSILVSGIQLSARSGQKRLRGAFWRPDVASRHAGIVPGTAPGRSGGVPGRSGRLPEASREAQKAGARNSGNAPGPQNGPKPILD